MSDERVAEVPQLRIVPQQRFADTKTKCKKTMQDRYRSCIGLTSFRLASGSGRLERGRRGLTVGVAIARRVAVVLEFVVELHGIQDRTDDLNRQSIGE